MMVASNLNEELLAAAKDGNTAKAKLLIKEGAAL